MSRRARSPRTPSRHAIVVGTDFSKTAENAVERAIRIAKAAHAPLHIVHASSRLPRTLVKALGLGKDEHAERAAIESVLEGARAYEVSARGYHVRGAPAAALRSKVRELSAALVVVGTRGRAVPDTFVGSTAERIAAFVRVPVLLVRRSAHRPYRDVIIAADATMDLGAAVAASALVAPGRDFSVVHAYEGPFETTLRLHGANEASIQSYRRSSRREARAALLRRMQDTGVDRGRLVLRHGDPRRVLQQEEHRSRDVLLVIQRGRSEVGHFLLGSVTRAIVAHGTADVLIT